MPAVRLPGMPSLRAGNGVRGGGHQPLSARRGYRCAASREASRAPGCDPLTLRAGRCGPLASLESTRPGASAVSRAYARVRSTRSSGLAGACTPSSKANARVANCVCRSVRSTASISSRCLFRRPPQERSAPASMLSWEPGCTSEQLVPGSASSAGRPGEAQPPRATGPARRRRCDVRTGRQWSLLRCPG